MDEIGSAHSETRISSRRLDENLFERSLIEDFPICNAVECNAAGKAYGFLPGAGMQRAKHFK